MEPTEAVRHIIDSCPKNQLWCAVTPDEKEQIWLRVAALRILNGTAKQSTKKKFFKLLGYSYREVVAKP